MMISPITSHHHHPDRVYYVHFLRSATAREIFSVSNFYSPLAHLMNSLAEHNELRKILLAPAAAR